MAEGDNDSIDYSSILDDFSFYFAAKPRQLYKIFVDEEHLTFLSKNDSTKKLIIKYRDIIQSRVRISDAQARDTAEQNQVLEILSIPKVNSLFSNKSVRKRLSERVGTNSYTSPVKNVAVLQHVKDEIDKKLSAQSQVSDGKNEFVLSHFSSISCCEGHYCNISLVIKNQSSL